MFEIYKLGNKYFSCQGLIVFTTTIKYKQAISFLYYIILTITPIILEYINNIYFFLQKEISIH